MCKGIFGFRSSESNRIHVDWVLKNIDGNIKNDHSDKTSIS